MAVGLEAGLWLPPCDTARAQHQQVCTAQASIGSGDTQRASLCSRGEPRLFPPQAVQCRP